MEQKEDKLKEVISHAKEYGFVFPSSEIYDGLSATYDYGQLGSELKNNIKNFWWKAMTQLHDNIVGIDASIFMHPTTWKASGHVDAFNDPLIDNKDSKKRYRADVLLEEHMEKIRIKNIGLKKTKNFLLLSSADKLREPYSRAPKTKCSKVSALWYTVESHYCGYL